MAQLDKTTFQGKYNNSSTGLFKDNTTHDIGADDSRSLVDDIKDSFLNRVDDLIDEDSMASDSATKVPSQQSVKAYIDNEIDNVASGIVSSWKDAVIVATTADITLSGEQTLDGVLTSASRVLVKNQTAPEENGIYVSAAGAWARSTDTDIAAELEGAAVSVQQGTTQANTNWLQTTDNITLGTSNIVWILLGSSAPDATPTVKGLAKLYTGTGSNTDGAMDQNSVTTELAGKQATLVSATNIKTVNGTSILGAGDIPLPIVAASFVDNEVPSGSGVAFTLANTPVANSVKLYRNGVRQKDGGIDYSISGANITLATTIGADTLLADYRK